MIMRRDSLAAVLAVALALVVGSVAHARQVALGDNRPEPHPLAAPFGAMRLNDAKYVTSEAEHAAIDALIRALRFERYALDRMWMQTDPGTIFMQGGHALRATDSAAAGFAPTPGDLQLVLVPEAWKLIELGPKAIPALLAALDDGTPVAKARGLSGSFITSDDDNYPISRSNSNRRERAILESMLPAQQPSKHFFGEEDQIARGDLAAAILGEIVFRDYAVFDRKVNALDSASPVRNPKVTEALRTIWTSDSPERTLAASLSEDLTRLGNGASGAVGRLGYYFPEEATDVIVAALDGSLPIGLYDVTLDRSAIWSIAANASPRTMEALGRRLASAQSAPEIAALLVPALIRAHAGLAQTKLVTLAGQPGGEHWWQPHRIAFSSMLELMPEESRAAVEQALAVKDPGARMAVLGAIYRAATPPTWLGEVVSPLLTDETKTQSVFGGSGRHGDEPDYLRVMDAAAVVVAKHVPGVVFDPSVEVPDRDAAIVRAQTTLTSIARGDRPPAAAPERVAPVASVVVEEPNAWVWFSQASTLDRVIGMTLGDCGGTGVRIFDIRTKSGVVTQHVVRLADGSPAPGDLTMLREGREGKAVVLGADAIFSIDSETGALTPLVKLPASEEPRRGTRDVLVVGDRVLTTNARGDLLATSFVGGATETVWESTLKNDDDQDHRMPHSISLSRYFNPDRVIIDVFASRAPSTVIDLTTGKAALLTGLPSMGWVGGVGRYASNNLNSFGTLWDLSTLKQVALPVPAAELEALVGTRDGSIVIGQTKTGDIVVIDMKSSAVIATLGTGRTADPDPHILFTDDEQTLVCLTSMIDEAHRGPPKAIKIDVFDVSRWTGAADR